MWFVVAGPWEQSPGPDAPTGDARDAFTIASQFVQIVLQVLGVVGGGLLALRNTRAGRADRRRAAIVAAYAGISLILSSLVGNHYAGTAILVWQRLLAQLGIVLFWSVVLWLDYLALEPFVRRRWPEAMISWTRLLAGRFGDPLVARDILIGCAGASAILIINDTIAMVPEWLGQPPVTPQGTGSIMRALGPIGLFAAEVLRRPSRILLESMFLLFLILLAHVVLRNRWLATAAMMAAYAAIIIDRAAVLQSTIASVVLIGGVVALVSRFGVLAYVAAWFVLFAILDLPLSLDRSAWYAARSATTAAMILSVAGWAFYRSLGGRSPFGTAFD